MAIENIFQVIEILGNEARKIAEEGRQVVPKKGGTHENGTTYDRINKLDPKWDLILIENPWWTRIWTLQEIVLAKEANLCNDPVMLAEADRFPERWEDLDPSRPVRHLVSAWWNGQLPQAKTVSNT
ncbi:hypothetical protein B0T21DRAFT_454996 [Apiosordaria backusii]|uniref:Heterokaryon incompatibility domain-containing protein n=1 Tax=Apiosordaria backusii TaxID=314023 RepID=A0AA40A7B3_9PEZI|nr:hypothetical protein B0T21DRAFT_454996 [Apiosordaria backusii]